MNLKRPSIGDTINIRYLNGGLTVTAMAVDENNNEHTGNFVVSASSLPEFTQALKGWFAQLEL